MAHLAKTGTYLDDLPDFMHPRHCEKRLLQKFDDANVVKEHRIDLPLSVEEYHIGQLYAVAEASKNETGGGEGVEVAENKPFEYGGKKGQYTLKIMYLKTKVPGFVRLLAPKGSLVVYEEAWNCYPWCRTIYTNGYMKEHFYLCLDTWHKDGKGDIPNVHELSGRNLKLRDNHPAIKKTDPAGIDYIDIVNDPIPTVDGEDPGKFRSEKAQRGPWAGLGWSSIAEPVMCCYKLYYVKFSWFGLQNRVERIILDNVHKILLNLHRQVVCWLDKWYGMTIEDIRELEARTKEELNQKRQQGQVSGLVVKEK